MMILMMKYKNLYEDFEQVKTIPDICLKRKNKA
jgi:hypothetical protein